MSKQSLLLVDGDTRSLRVLEVSLRKNEFMVTAASSVQDALGKLELHAPDLIISETTFPDGDGFELRRRVRATPEWSEIPFIFLTAEAAIENKIRGLELGVDDYLTKPIYIKEIVTRINILLQKRQRIRFEERRDGRTRFAGRVQDMQVVDVIQTIEISRKSGVIQFVGERGRQAAIYFRDGRVIDAEAGPLQGEDAVYRLLTWSEGEFEVVFRTVRRREVITMSSQGLLMEGMRRLDEWSRLFEQLPPLTHRFEVDTIELAGRLGDVPDDNNRILRLFDGKRTLLEVIDASDVGDLECLQAISRLYFEELLLDLDHEKTPRREMTKPIPRGDHDSPTAVEDATSGPLSFGASVDSEPEQRTDDASLDLGEDAPADAAGPEAEPDAAGDGGADPSDATDDAAQDDDEHFDEHERRGPLMGGYRQSSLRLIDEAVAAAQAIEPSLFEDSQDEAAHPPGHGGNGVSRPVGHADGAAADAALAPTPPAGMTIPVVEDRPLRARSEREESGLRMIGSLGRDRAEASGELAPLGHARPQRSETARELVTILPRRVTREIPVVTVELADSLLAAASTSQVTVAPAVAPAIEIPALPLAAAQVALPGTGVHAVSRSRRLLRMVRSVDGSGPGLGALLLIFLAAVLAVTAVVLRLRRHTKPAAQLERIHDTAQPAATPDRADSRSAPMVTSGNAGPLPGNADVAEGTLRPTAVVTSGSGTRALASAGQTVPDGSDLPPAPDDSDTVPVSGPVEPGSATGVALPAAGSRATGPVGAGSPGTTSPSVVLAGERPRPGDNSEKLAEAKGLYDKAHDAFEAGNAARALELAESSLKLRKTARTYLLRAQAEQRLGRVDAALASVELAARLAPDFATTWELRGRILWAAQRRDEARVAFEKFLELEPNNPKSASIRRLLNEPR